MIKTQTKLILSQIIFLFFITKITHLNAQIIEDFSDGSFSDGTPLTWSGSQVSGMDDFLILLEELRSNGPSASSTIFISTPLNIDFANNDVSWTFKIRYSGGAPSSSNYVEIYLISNVSDLTNNPVGYFIKMGERGSNDGIDLFRTNTSNAIIEDTENLISSSLNVHIRVARSNNGMWRLEADNSGNDNFRLIGTAMDATINTGNFFGFLIKHSSTRNQSFFIDTVTINQTPIPDNQPPTITSVEAVEHNLINVLFSESVDETTSEETDNYRINKGINILNAEIDDQNNSLVQLTISELANGNTYILTINGIKDVAENIIEINSMENFEYIVISEALPNDVVINEFMADPSDEQGLPEIEYIELFNRTEKIINLNGWTISDDNGSSPPLPDYLLFPMSYVVITPENEENLLNNFGNVLKINGFRSLNNDGDKIIIQNKLNTIIDEITYTNTTTGVSLELINPLSPCKSIKDYDLSNENIGGTPGNPNSILDLTPDSLPPMINRFLYKNERLTIHFTELMDSASLTHSNNYTANLLNVNSIIATKKYVDSVQISFAENLTDGLVYSLQISEITDCTGNRLTTRNIEFGKSASALPGEIIINEFMADPSDEQGLPEIEYIELFNRTEKIINLNGWTISDDNGSSPPLPDYLLYPMSYVVITPENEENLLNNFGNILKINGFRSLNNNGDKIIIRNRLNTIIDEITYTNTTTGVSLELINPISPCKSIKDYNLSNENIGGTPGNPNSILDLTPDSQPPMINRFLYKNEKLTIHFTELMDSTSLTHSNNYTSNLLNVNSIIATKKYVDSVQISFAENLTDGLVYSLQISEISDCTGNRLENRNIEFGKSASALPSEIIINEFMADPSDEIGLPEIEYIELFNLSEKIINLNGWTISDDNGSSPPLPDYLLFPMSYVVITPENEENLLNNFRNVLKINGFRSLNNDGDKIIIRNRLNTIIDEITYTNTTTGVSLELINPLSPCKSIKDYDISNENIGGTPGNPNSILDLTPDSLPPMINRFLYKNERLTIHFTELMDSASLTHSNNYTSNLLNVNSIIVTKKYVDSVQISFAENLTDGLVYSLQISEISDCTGNRLENRNIEFGKSASALPGEIIINEFMADPSDEQGLPEIEYIELFNRTEKIINLNGWTISDDNGSSPPIPDYLLYPMSYVVITPENEENLLNNFRNVLKINGFRSLNNDGDKIIIRNRLNTIIDEITYTNTTTGVSLELINPLSPCKSIKNYDLSNENIGGTPGNPNSILNLTPDSLPPMINRFLYKDERLTIHFTELMDSTSLTHSNNYTSNLLNVNSIIATKKYVDSVQISFAENLTDGLVYSLQISEITDCTGNRLTSRNIEFGKSASALPSEIIINEFMADPSDEQGLPEIEYIELFNRTEKIINLNGWTISDDNGSSPPIPDYLLYPMSYVVITPENEENLLNNFRNVLKINGFRSLNNDGDKIIIRNNLNTVIDEITYTNTTTGVSLELINPLSPCKSIKDYDLSNENIGGTPGNPNSILDLTPDSLPPTINKFLYRDERLTIHFTELMDSASLTHSNNYTSNLLNVNSIITTKKYVDSVQISFAENLTDGLVYSLQISEITDCTGNRLENRNIEFGKSASALPSEIIINEFMADPSDEQGLPEIEYIELFNLSEKIINLNGWTISDDNGSSPPLPDYLLFPMSYVVITPENEENLLNNFGNVLKINGFRSLNNDGDKIIIRNNLNTVIDEITYTNTTTGVSLELINPLSPCKSIKDYDLSNENIGGTPGNPNSILDLTPDSLPPMINRFLYKDERLIIHFTELMDSTSLTHSNNYTSNLLNVNSIVATKKYVDSVQIFFAENLTDGLVYSLQISEITDCTGNRLTSRNIEFGKSASALPSEIIINEFMADPSDEQGLPEIEYIELFNRTEKIINLNGWTISDDNGSSPPLPDYLLYPMSYVVITPENEENLLNNFGNVLKINGFRSLNNDGDKIIIRNRLNTIIDEITYTNTTTGVSLELINPLSPCKSIKNYDLSNENIGGTPGNPNSILDLTPDSLPPTINRFLYRDERLTIHFTELMDSASLTHSNNYTSNLLNVNSIIATKKYVDSVQISFSENLTDGLVYSLQISEITDCTGNRLENRNIEFGKSSPPLFNELLITEIFFDTEPSIGLPQQEFVEIFNRTEKIISTAGMWFKDASSTINFPLLTLQPMSYYIIARNTSLFTEYKVIKIPGFPTLDNSGEQLILGYHEEVIFSVNYSPDWHDEEKINGGYSLELIDIENSCVEKKNWISSIAQKGGTPGYANSVAGNISNNTNISLIAVEGISTDTLKLHFDKKIHPNRNEQTSFILDPSVPIRTFFYEIESPFSLFIILDDTLEKNKRYKLVANHVEGCKGQILKNNNLSFILPITPSKGEILLSEILFNPKINGVDFVELFNYSDKYLNLQGLKLAGSRENDEVVISERSNILKPRDYVVLTPNTTALLNQFPRTDNTKVIELERFPTFPNDEGDVKIISFDGIVWDSLYYNKEFHYDLLEDVEGVSLERISYEIATEYPNNWRSAASTEGFATPGYKNSQRRSNITSNNNKLTIEPKVIIPGNSGFDKEFTTITYATNTAGQFANVSIYNQKGRLVKHLAEGVSLSTSNFFIWDGTTDSGNLADIGYHIILFEIYDQQGNTQIIKNTIIIGRNF